MGSAQTEGHTVWVEVNLSALRHNLAGVRGVVGRSVKIMAVVKANAYGHGVVESAKAFVEAGADCLGVTMLEEGLELRKGGVNAPVLIFSPLLPDQVEAALSEGLEQTVCDLGMVQRVSELAAETGKTARVHVKVDTGMGRLGVAVDDCPEFLYRLLSLPGIQMVGIYTHFANAGAWNLSHAREQNARFSNLLAELAAKDIPVGLRHAANSAAILNLQDSHYDMVRPGTILYGQLSAQRSEKRLDLRETWCLKTRIVAIRRLSRGTEVGYGSEFTASRPTLAAVLPIGYADGFTLIPESAARRAARPLRLAANRLLGIREKNYVTVRGKKAPVIGRISMQMCSIDVTDIPDVQIGDEVVVPARRATASSRIPRLYVMRNE
ncbi:MAG TPA: alanine racemase [Armatimonadota bacterium]|nr:alanine racemase [Armatimonadota bacterium]